MPDINAHKSNFWIFKENSYCDPIGVVFVPKINFVEVFSTFVHQIFMKFYLITDIND